MIETLNYILVGTQIIAMLACCFLCGLHIGDYIFEKKKPNKKYVRPPKYFAIVTVREVYNNDKYLLFNPDDMDTYYMILPGIEAHEGTEIQIEVHGTTMHYRKV